MSDRLNTQEASMLREELEILMNERTSLLQVAGAAAVLVANTDALSLPPEAAEAAEMLSKYVNDLPEETLKDALDMVHAEIESGDR
ncbi:hypothetical protein [Candidatus Nitrotoga fabula]|uniref:Uncharacterized protein n=1 Tax=Candidatus Nitrotoga fabula TaxID=2182327 RepID=A0A2X0QRN8_9PROT|nr:hypothetical protein [Candidatus Nitrotoga fabula]CAE6700974.1 conserved hypothetical protein [Candidatus Nitrotoga fabula]SPS04723.1 conserved protein of unknown function [Candidatus Nitrotoga fabula]